jgi:hypothetical protein
MNKPVINQKKSHKSGLSSKAGSLAWISPKTIQQGHSTVKKGGSLKLPETKSAKLLLGELYIDREYLLNLINDKDFGSKPNKHVSVLVDDALIFLHTRVEFWRQQKPVYARRNLENRDLQKQILIRNKTLITEIRENHKLRQIDKLRTDYDANNYSRPSSAPVTSETTRDVIVNNKPKSYPKRLGAVIPFESHTNTIDKASKKSLIRSKRIQQTDCRPSTAPPTLKST